MITKKRAGEAVRAVACSSEGKGELLCFLDSLPDQELDKWLIDDQDDNKIIWSFVRTKAKASAAGLGVGSAAGAGAAAGLGITRAGDAGAAAGQGVRSAAGAGLAPQTAELTQIIKGVTRLMHGTEPVGSACLLVDGLTGRWVLVTARHCLSPQQGKPIGDLGLTAYGYKLRHVASYPEHDISVLAFMGNAHEDANLQRTAIPFELAGGVGLAPGWRVSAVGFPLAVDKDVPGAKSSANGVLLSGIISWLDRNLDLALGDYTGTMPNFSGGAVALSGGPTGTLVGVHLGAVWHQEGEPPASDDVRPQGDQPAEGALGEGLRRDVMETDRWCEAPRVAMLSTGTKKRRTSGSTSTSQGKDGSLAEAVIQYCVANVPHKGSLSYFVPAHTLHRLLQSALSTQGTAAGTAAGGGPAGLGDAEAV